MTALVSFERVFEVLDLIPMVRDKADAKSLPSTPLEIEFSEVKFSYPRAEEISLASLESVAKPELVQSGEILRGISFVAARWKYDSFSWIIWCRKNYDYFTIGPTL